MLIAMKKFLKDEDGAVTIDWVVLTAGLALMGVTVVNMIQDSATDVSTGLGADIVDYGTKAMLP